MQIREWGYYRRRDGNVVGPMRRDPNPADSTYPFVIGVGPCANEDTYMLDGRYDDDLAETPLDLIAEVGVDGVSNGAHIIAAALRTNRGTQPTADGYYMCYVKRARNPALEPVMLKRDNGRWFDTMYVPDPVVVTWCGPMPAVELGA